MNITTPKFVTAINDLNGEIHLEKHATLAEAKLYIESFFDDEYSQCCKDNLEEMTDDEDIKYSHSFQITNLWDEEENEWDYSMFEFLITILPL